MSGSGFSQRAAVRLSPGSLPVLPLIASARPSTNTFAVFLVSGQRGPELARRGARAKAAAWFLDPHLTLRAGCDRRTASAVSKGTPHNRLCGPCQRGLCSVFRSPPPLSAQKQHPLL